MLQITRSGLIITGTEELARQREKFAQRHAAVLPKLLSADVLEYLLPRLERADFAHLSHYDGAGTELAREEAVSGQDVSMHLLSMLLNGTQLFEALQQLTECPPIGNFQGRIYRLMAQAEHYQAWHNDKQDGSRLLGLSINLSSEPYGGGVFQLREKQSKQILCEIAHTELGDAHLFRISPELQHRVTPVEGTVIRLAIAGWFHSGPNLHELIKENSNPVNNRLSE